MIARCLWFWVLCFVAPVACTAYGQAVMDDDPWRYLDNGRVRLGIDLSRGGALGFFAPVGRDNLINQYDTGRFIQQSYYGDVDGSAWGRRPWRYNPVQGGGYDNTPAKVSEFRANEYGFYCRTTPRNWARPAQECSEAVMEQWLSLEGDVARLRYRLTYTGLDHTESRHQEMPAVFLDSAYSQLVMYQGDRPWTGDALTRLDVEPSRPLRNAYAENTEHWAAYVNPQTREAIGVFTPGTSHLTYYRFVGDGRGGPDGSACSYFAPLRTFRLEAGLVLEYDVYLTVGTIDEVRRRFAERHGDSD